MRGRRPYGPRTHHLGAEWNGDPLPRLEDELRRIDHAEIHLDDLRPRPANRRHLRPALSRLLRQLPTPIPSPPEGARAGGGGVSVHLRALELREQLRGEDLDLPRLVRGIADGVEDEVRAPRLDEAVELLRALGRGADDAVLSRERPEVLGIALRDR